MDNIPVLFLTAKQMKQNLLPGLVLKCHLPGDIKKLI